MPQPLTEIIVRLPDQTQHRYVLEPGEYLVGRDPSCPIRVDSPDVSRQHARLHIGEQDLRFEDLGSNNGSIIAGERLSGSIRLRFPQRIQLASAILEIRQLLEQSKSPSARPAPSLPMVDDTGFPPRGDKYAAGAFIGQGGMGAVVAVEDVRIQRRVAMKRLRLGKDASRESRLRFLQEARVLGQLEHPNIVPIHDLDLNAEGEIFYTMKLVKGMTLHQVLGGIKAGNAGTVPKYPLNQLLTIFQKVCDAVSFAHSKGIVHRDLKPENIMLGDFGEVLVMDWGLAKILKSEPDRLRELPPTNGAPDGLTRASVLPLLGERAGVRGKEPSEDALSPHPPETPPLASAGTRRAIEGFRETDSLTAGGDLRTMEGKIMGTPNFMAPEQAEGRVGDIDARTDVFALGGILYNLLTLRVPAEGATAHEVMDKIKRGYIAPPVYYNQPGALEPDGSKREKPVALSHCPGGKVPEALSAVAMKALAQAPTQRYQTVVELQKDIEAYQGGFATSAEQASTFRQLGLLFQRHKTVSLSAALIVLLVGGFTIKLTLTLRELRKSAPAFFSEAQTFIEQKDFTNALGKIAIALTLRPDVAEYHLLQGNVYQSLLRFKEARQAYERAARRDSGSPVAAENLALSQKLLTARWDTPKQKSASLEELWRAMIRQGRSAEAQALVPRIERDKVDQEYLDKWKATLDKSGIRAGLKLDSEGRLLLDLSNSSITNLEPLKALALTSLNLSHTPVTDLQPLHGTWLAKLYLDGTPVSDLTPLRGVPLQELNLMGTPVSDLSPLRSMALKALWLAETKVTDLRPLQGTPLNLLAVNHTAVSDLTPLKGALLANLELSSTKVRDLTPLHGMPLVSLTLDGTEVQNLAPLRGMPLGRLNIGSTKVTDLSPLTGMPMTSIGVALTAITNFSPIKDWPLVELTAWQSRFDDTAMLLLKGKHLERIDLWGSKVTKIDVLEGMPVQRLILDWLPVADISLARDMPLEELGIRATKVTNFAPIRGKQLRALGVSETPFNDMNLLAGMPLVSLRVASCPINDLSLLRGKLLTLLDISGTQVSDLSPLKGMHLTDLAAGKTRIIDLATLAGMPLQRLELDHTAVRDISVLRGMPLRVLLLDGCDQLKDLGPLAACRGLEELRIPEIHQGIDFLRQLPNLRSLSYGPYSGPAAEFWKAYDARKK